MGCEEIQAIKGQQMQSQEVAARDLRARAEFAVSLATGRIARG